MNWGIKVLQTSALPLGYVAICKIDNTLYQKKGGDIEGMDTEYD